MDESLTDTLRRGMAEQRAGRLVEAEHAFQKVLTANPNEPTALHWLGILALNTGRPAVAVELIGRAIAAGHDTVECQLNLGAAQLALGQNDAALPAFHRAAQLAKNPDHLRGAGRGLTRAGKPADAVPILRHAIAQRPDDPEFHRDLGMALLFNGQPIDAEAHLRRSFPQCADDPFVVNALGSCLGWQNKAAEAAECFERAIALVPPDRIPTIASFHWNLGRMLLLQGQFERGWQECEWRLLDPALRFKRDFPQPQWSGENLTGKTILLHAEGGHGDTIQFMRFVPQIVTRGATILLECQPALVRLLQAVPGVRQIIPRGEPLPPFDFQISLFSLPFALKTTLATLPVSVPYLHAAPQQVEHWRRRFADDAGFKVGLVWCGSELSFDVRTRTLSAFAPLADIPRVSFYGLQKGAPASEPAPKGMQFISLDPEIADFADAAAAIVNLDLVVTVDTAAAHLAGALGKPVWVLIPFNPDFRWMLDREDTPWYPTMRLFRQSSPSQWADVLQRVRSELGKHG